jgi:uncharacterized protein YjiS (DUF1127 family)
MVPPLNFKSRARIDTSFHQGFWRIVMRVTDIVAIRHAVPSTMGSVEKGWMPKIVLATAKTALGWADRLRQRRALDLLDDRLLKDVGLDRFRAEQEARKPFWQA